MYLSQPKSEGEIVPAQSIVLLNKYATELNPEQVKQSAGKSVFEFLFLGSRVTPEKRPDIGN